MKLDNTIQDALAFISKHNFEAEHLRTLETLKRTFSADAQSIEEIAKKASSKKLLWKATLIVGSIFLVCTVIAGFITAGLSLLSNEKNGLEAYVIPFILASLILVAFRVMSHAAEKVDYAEKLSIFKDPIRGTDRCIDLLKFKSESERVSKYIESITKQRELLVFDFAVCRALLIAEQNSVNQELEQEKIQLACAELHSA